jgi:phosphoesterase RecJ-like protein
MTDAGLHARAAALRTLLEPLDDVWITVHESPDGDSIGAALAMQRVLAKLGKRAVAIRQHPFPRHYETLPGAESMGDANDLGRLFQPRVIVAVDVGSFERVGAISDHIGPQTTVINIDHHHGSECPANAGATLNLVDPEYASTTALVYALCSTAWPGCIDAGTASCLYVGLITDTGCFRFSNTDARTLRIGAELAGLGADPGNLSEDYMFRRRPEGLRLLGEVLGTLQFHSGVRLATLVLTHAMLQRSGGRMDETEGFVNYATSLEGVEVAAFLREVSEASTRVSLRSSHDFDVSVVARTFGGGGHRKAAGLSIPRGVAEARTLVVDAILDHLQAWAPEPT